MTVSEYDGRLANMACHVLCARTNLMPRVQSLLGLGFNYCLRKPVVDMDVEKTMSRLRNDIRRNYFFANRVEEIEEDEGRYIPELYIKSVWDAPVANKEVESRMDDFEKRLVHLNKSHRKYVGTNLSPSQQRTCDEIRASNAYRAWPSDKNLGPSWCETELYTERGITDHLGNDRAYRLLTEALARSRMIKLGYDYRSFIMCNNDSLSEAESTFLWRTCRECGPKLSRFYLTAKVHKTPWATRPVVSTCGTMMAGLSKWLDYWLQKLRSQVHSYLQDSSHLLRLLNEFGQLPPGARLFTADAVGMYTNIDTTHGIQVIDDWIDELGDDMPDGFPAKAVKEALRLVMKTNIFEFGDSFFEQISGCAMGTPVACIYATLYYAYHERSTLLSKYKSNLPLYTRFIDDIFGIWVPDNDNPDAWEEFKQDLPFGILEWDVIERSKNVNFLDLTISINDDRRIEHRTFQKAMNLYLYLPATSAHPPSVIRGMIYGLLRKYREQNTHREHYIKMAVLLFRRLLARGWDEALLKNLFDNASTKVETLRTSRTQERKDATNDETRRQRLFIHSEYHPDGIPKKKIRQAFKETCGDAFQDLATENGGTMKITETTICYSRPKNLCDLLTSAKLKEVKGRGVSTFVQA